METENPSEEIKYSWNIAFTGDKTVGSISCMYNEAFDSNYKQAFCFSSKDCQQLNQLMRNIPLPEFEESHIAWQQLNDHYNYIVKTWKNTTPQK